MINLNSEKLKAIYSYDPDTGIVIRIRDGVRAGSEFTCGTDKKRYRRVRVDGRDVSEHRVIWAIVYGKTPDKIDHRDGDGTNNKLVNLREATLTQNQQNRKLSKSNSTGLKGVSVRKDSNKFFAFIKQNKKTKYLGAYNTAEEAHAVYVQAATKLHGEFINLGDNCAIQK
jgi:HNH endonuclease/AP2 domain